MSEQYSKLHCYNYIPELILVSDLQSVYNQLHCKICTMSEPGKPNF